MTRWLAPGIAIPCVIAIAGGCAPTSPASALPQADPPAPVAEVEATPERPSAEVETAVAPSPRPCASGERLDSGCQCSDGACFDICCGPNAACAHPAAPGGPSACILQPLAAADEPASPPPRACTDGERLRSGCVCEDRVCMDICCVGSACSHHPSPEGGWAKCISVRKR